MIAGRLVQMPVMLREMGLLILVMLSPRVQSEQELETSEDGPAMVHEGAVVIPASAGCWPLALFPSF